MLSQNLLAILIHANFVRKKTYQIVLRFCFANTFRKIKLAILFNNMTHNLFNTQQTFKTGDGTDGTYYSLPQLEKEGIAKVSRLPISIRIVLESVLRNFDEGKKVSESAVRQIANCRTHR
jgi:hypothetical protein